MRNISLLTISSNSKLKKKIKKKRWRRLKVEMIVKKLEKAICSWMVMKKTKSR